MQRPDHRIASVVFGDAKFRDDAIGGICGSMFRNGAKGENGQKLGQKRFTLGLVGCGRQLWTHDGIDRGPRVPTDECRTSLSASVYSITAERPQRFVI